VVPAWLTGLLTILTWLNIKVSQIAGSQMAGAETATVVSPITGKFYAGCWYTYPSEKSEFVSRDDDIPNIWKNLIPVPNHQPDKL
jgi:hypothetical protein